LQTGDLVTSAPAMAASGRAGHPPVPSDPALPRLARAARRAQASLIDRALDGSVAEER
jgi:hypothetical protein